MLKDSEQILRKCLSCELFGTDSPFLQRIQEIGSQSDKYPPNNTIPNCILVLFQIYMWLAVSGERLRKVQFVFRLL